MPDFARMAEGVLDMLATQKTRDRKLVYLTGYLAGIGLASAEPFGTKTITKEQLQRALVDSGVSYEQPPEHDTEEVWDRLTRDWT